MAYEVQVFQPDGAGGYLPSPEITISEVSDNASYRANSSFSTSNGGLHQTNYFRFSSLFEAQEFARNYGR
jgi:hypothetical protein